MAYGSRGSVDNLEFSRALKMAWINGAIPKSLLSTTRSQLLAL